MIRLQLPAKEELEELIHCDFVNGIYVWKQRKEVTREDSIFNSNFEGKIIGTTARKDLIIIRIRKYGRFPLHRIVWLLYYGEPVPHTIDHKDTNPLNNRIDNLRDATTSENAINRVLSTNNTTGVNGVVRRSDGRF